MPKPQKVDNALRPFGPDLDHETLEKLSALQEKIAAKKLPKKPLTLEAFRKYHGLDYQDLALVIGASDRSHAWRLSVGTGRPRWDFCLWIVAELKGAVSFETLTDLTLRK